MAPVGSYPALHAAIQAGADAVYFGVNSICEPEPHSTSKWKI